MTTPRFYELRMPRTDNMDGITGRKDWCTCDIGGKGYFLLNDGSGLLADVAGLDYKDFYFDTEAACHKTAFQYYQRYSKSYPYTDAWVDTGMDGGSQVMEFEK